MNKILLFGGTGEGRALAEWLLAEGIPHTVCVATEYGETLLPPGRRPTWAAWSRRRWRS